MNRSETRYGPKGYLFPENFKEIGRDIYNMEIRPDDTFVVTFPRSGTTWTQDMVWLIANNLDYETASQIPLQNRYSFIDMAMFLNSEMMEKMVQDVKLQQATEVFTTHTVEKVTEMDSPRFIKTHVPLSLLPPKLLDTCKVIYVARDPRDVAVSFYHHSKSSFMVKDMDFKAYWNLFIRDLVPWSPYFSHILEAWEARQHPNMRFLFYEELSMDLPSIVRRVARFLGKQMTDEQVDQLCDHLNIDNFKKNKSVNLEDIKELGFMDKNESFIRKGKVGAWRDYFDDEMSEQAKQWMQENLEDTDLYFPR